ncbi:erp5p [Saccharomyces arboricola H-6]|uniref:Erp5p n=1 Tax=Saccharomyces arboricola (strain H-6 / AS 2.3317 / CBS 10644) TaxID=1160507 RepID=J8Q777_SACAR|nr:erp5p [Saccharomyces arboricola H-6]
MKHVLAYGMCIFFAFIHGVEGVHYYSKSGETKCFYENLSRGNLLIGDLDLYVEKNGMFEEDSEATLTITVDETFDNDHRVLNQKNSHTGDFTFTALDTGEHRVCLTPSYSKKSTPLRIFIELEIGNVEALDSKRKDDVNSLKRRVVQLTQRLSSIRKEQDTIREKEAEFRNQSESANSKIMTWSVFQFLILVGTCAFQLRYLKNFFVKQKIV